jgi:hypothetical protein
LPFSYYRRLSARQKRIYDRSVAVQSVRLQAGGRFAPLVAALALELQRGERAGTERAAGRLTGALLDALHVPAVRVRVLAARPSRSWGELHGLYEPRADAPPLITLWMRTAQRRQVVAFKTFLRTLLHEVVHHLDYKYLKLEDSLHTEGFYKRESSLFHQLVPDPALFDAPAKPAAAPPRAAEESAAAESGAPEGAVAERAAGDGTGRGRGGRRKPSGAAAPKRGARARTEQTLLPFGKD